MPDININKASVLFIAPLPPPIDGQSKASDMSLQALNETGYVTLVVNVNRRNLSRSFKNQLCRGWELVTIYKKIILSRNKAEHFYLSLSESRLGNLKDLIVYLILFKRLDRLTIQMLGGAGMNRILNNTLILSSLNLYLMKKMRGVIVEGHRGLTIFEKGFSREKIKLINNFADEYLFVSENDINEKFKKEKLQILYLSNMIKEKGYADLLTAFVALSEEIKRQYQLNFVGGFPEEIDRVKFLNSISNEPSVEYLGRFIDGEEKKALYNKTHIFCLPTYYPYEGQPISILEGYATGCAVITTLHAGIPDIFADHKNGFAVRPFNPQDISEKLTSIVARKEMLKEIALWNWREAKEHYRSERYRKQIVDAMFGKSND
jgi:glycosyltransferase involved in cell wall biosynthesis